MRKYLFLFLSACCLTWNARAQQSYELSSPNGEIKVSVRLEDKIYYDIAYDGETLLKDNAMKLQTTERTMGEFPKLSKKQLSSVKETLTPVVPLKFSTVNNEYNKHDITHRKKKLFMYQSIPQKKNYLQKHMFVKYGHHKVGNTHTHPHIRKIHHKMMKIMISLNI